MNEINMVPFIDVMLVLLIIFMVSAPMITTGLIDVPSVGKSRAQPESVLQVLIDGQGKLKFKQDKSEPEALDLSALVQRVKAAQAGNANVPVVISADRKVQYESVVQVMDKLQGAGVLRVGLSVKSGGNAR
ncbi:biopolymer transport protein TolR [Inhella inkyongensis]|uniref:Biopolymer transport protein TolR n=2 Tax=Inhella inkyongensis TaxID=392593 RepID=A0A840S3Q9_9BURK|nr:biopolymer transport protein TolR [Inhella inkyongensis]